MKRLLLCAALLLAGCQDHGYSAGQVVPLNAPEMSAADAVSALTLTAGIVCLIAGRRK